MHVELSHEMALYVLSLFCCLDEIVITIVNLTRNNLLNYTSGNRRRNRT